MVQDLQSVAGNLVFHQFSNHGGGVSCLTAEIVNWPKDSERNQDFFYFFYFLNFEENL